MKNFETPEIEVMAFSVADVITESGIDFIAPEQGENQTPYG